MYKVGDVVTIRKDLIINKCYGVWIENGCLFNEDQVKFLGKKAKIKEVIHIGRGNNYLLDFKNDYSYWNNSMFTTNRDIQDIDKVIEFLSEDRDNMIKDNEKYSDFQFNQYQLNAIICGLKLYSKFENVLDEELNININRYK